MTTEGGTSQALPPAVEAQFAAMTRENLQGLLQRLDALKKSGADESSPELRQLTTILQSYQAWSAQRNAQRSVDKAASTVNGTSSDHDALSKMQHLTPGQSAQFRVQVLAMRALQANTPVPEEVMIAIASPEAALKYVTNHESGSKATINGVTHPAEPEWVYEEGDPDTSSSIYPFNSFKTPAQVKDELLKARRRNIIPTLLPLGLDPQVLLDERNRFIEARIANRIVELESLPNDLPDQLASLKVKALIELKSLNLLEKQKRLREDVMRGIGHATALSLVADRTAFKRVRQPTLRDSRLIEGFERKQKLEREQKAKQKHLAKLHSLQGHTSAMREAHAQINQAASKMGRLVARFHQDAEKAEKARLERVSKERLRALKADDEEAYLKLIDTAKDTRITHLLKQTDSFLSQLAQNVQAQQRSAGVQKQVPPPPPQPDEPEAVNETAFGAVAVFEDEDQSGAKVDYYSVAHRIKEPVTKQPDMLVGGTLKEYQLKGLQWMISLFNNKLNGILADEMGLGKTIQTISLITYLMELKRLPGPYLIIVPLSTMPNWIAEFSKWAPDIRVLVYKGTPNVRKQLGDEIRRMCNLGASPKTFHVVLTTYEFIIRDRLNLARPNWVHMIIDEGHRMKNTQSKLATTLGQYYRTQYRLILTGTPLQNNLPELWALLNFVLPKVFNSVQSFDEWFNTPFANTGGQDKIALNEEESLLVIRRLHKVLRPFLLRRLKKDVEADLPDKVERIIRCKMSSLQIKLYKTMKDHGILIVEDATAGKKQTGLKGLQNTVMQLRKICNHPFVYQAVEQSVKRPFQNEELLYRVSGKFELLDRMLPKLFATGHRVLMFFQMTQIMDIMQDYLAFRNVANLRLDGNTNQEVRGEIMRQFNEPDCPINIFLLSTRAGGLGLNLQSADTVILYDSDWNPHQDLQAQDRAHRIGQKKEVRIFRLVTSQSVEEHIVATANLKKEMDSKVIQAGKFDNNSTNAEREEHLRAVLEAQIEEEEMEGDYTDAELNEILARGDDEYDIFQQMDIDRRKSDEAHWRQLNPRGPPMPERLIQEYELPQIYRVEQHYKKRSAKEEEQELFDEYGARRKRGAANSVHYDDGLTEDQFLAAVEGEGGQNLQDAVTAAHARKDKRKVAQLMREQSYSNAPSPLASDSERGARNKSRQRVGSDSDGEDYSDSSLPSAQSRKRGRRSAASIEPSLNGDDDSDNPRSKRRKMISGTTAAKSVSNELKNAMNRIIDAVKEVTSPEDYLSCSLFMELPNKKEYADYYTFILQPISLKQIAQKIKKGQYDSPNALKRDFELMVKNAHTYNDPESLVARDANDLQAEFDARFAETFGTGQAKKRVIEDDESSNSSSSSSSSEDERNDSSAPMPENYVPPKIKLSFGNRGGYD